jgi:DNA-binding transcriptional MerR regulator
MAQQSITCPKCGAQIELTEAFTHSVEEKLRKEFNQKYVEEKSKLELRIKKQAEEELGIELKDLRKQLEEKSAKLKNAEEQELELRKRQRELEEREKKLQEEVRQKFDEQKSNWKIFSARISATTTFSRFPKVSRTPTLFSM